MFKNGVPRYLILHTWVYSNVDISKSNDDMKDINTYLKSALNFA